MRLRIVSGGQTGVDRAALDAALSLNLETGGWCPRGRRAEDGPIPARYSLRETPTAEYPQRTEWNIRDSDATLILCRRELQGGTALTHRLAAAMKKPWLVVDLSEPAPPEKVTQWIEEHGRARLNVAGPREKEDPGIGEQALRYLIRALSPFAPADS